MIAWILAAVLLSSLPQPVNLLGLWESTTTSRGGIGHTLEFRADGTCVEATTVIVDGYYRVIGDRLVQGEHPIGVEADTSKSSRIKLEGGILTETGPDGSIVQKERIGVKTANTGLVGAWKYRHYTDIVAFEKYTADGRMSFRLPMVSSVGRYALQNDRLTFVRPNQADTSMTIEVQADNMTIGSGNQPIHYRRDSSGPWYETEHIVRYPPK